MKSTLPSFETLLETYDRIYFIISPPRCSSTAFARIFWEHPSIRYYSHEPFETTYYANGELDEVYDKLIQPIDLSTIKSAKDNQETGNGLIIKEMPYQVGPNFEMALEWVSKPVIFLIRDPRLNIESRINKKLETGDSPFFPLQETGWHLINQQIEYCRSQHIPYSIVEASDLRNHPKQVLPKVFDRLGLKFYDRQLEWKADQNIPLDNLGGAHEHLYKKVLGSRTLQAATETIPPVNSFTEEGGIRAHVVECLEIYRQLMQDPYLITAN